MKRASSSFLVLFFAALLVTFQSYAQSQMIREEVRQTVRGYQRLSLSQALRMYYGEENQAELVSLTVRAQSLMNTSSQLELMQNGRLIGSKTARRQSSDLYFSVPLRTLVAGLELSAVSDVYIESITAQINRSYNPYPGGGQYEQQVSPNQFITLRVNQHVRGYGSIDLVSLVRQQLRLSLSGAQIERVVVQGQPTAYSRASVQVELNGRLVSDSKYLASSQSQLPLPVSSMEEVRQLSLRVNGDAEIFEVRIRVGQVRSQGPQYPGPQYPGPQNPGQSVQRVYVQQEVSSRYPLQLSSLLPYEHRLIRSVSIEARSRLGGQAQLILSGIYSGQQGAIMVNQSQTRATIRLARPLAASELQLISNSSVQVEALEIEFDRY
jgi:hypothetical protein